MTTEETTEKKTGMSEGRMAFMIYLILVAVLLVAGTVYYNVAVREYATGTPTDKGNVTAVGPLHLQLPTDWKVSTSADGKVSYAEPPKAECASDNQLACKAVAVHDYRTYTPGNIQALVAQYNCPTKKEDTDGQVTRVMDAAGKPKTIEIGEGEKKFGLTVSAAKLCRVGGGHTLTIFEQPAPPVAIIAWTAGKNTLPDITARLENKAAAIG